MWKKITFFVLAALLLVGALAALWPMLNNLHFEAKLQTIASEFAKQHKYRSLPWYHTDGFGSFYLGSDNDYDIFYYSGSTEMVTIPEYHPTDEDIINFYSTNIAGYVFYPATEILTYKDGVFAPLSEVFQQGFISKDAVSEAYAAFNDYVEMMLIADPLVMNERELEYYSNIVADDPTEVAYLQEKYKMLNEMKINPYISHFKNKIELIE